MKAETTIDLDDTITISGSGARKNSAWIDDIGNVIARNDNIVQLHFIESVKDICDAR